MLWEKFSVLVQPFQHPSKFIKLAKKGMGKNELYPIFAEPRAGDIVHSLSDISNARNLLGYIPRINLENGLENFIKGCYSPSLI
jgi:nucleoside-diphosphate-sugar epimerase